MDEFRPALSEDVFDDTYAAASERFRAAAARRGLAVRTWTNPRKGPRGETLDTLVVELGRPDAPNVVVLNSGVHGTEALACGAILASLIEAPLPTPDDTKLVLIHVLNPYGAAWSRYVNEDNVDLMKNLFYVDEVTPHDPLFVAFDDAIDLPHLRDSAASEGIARARKAFVDEHGLERLMASLKKGQSDRPKSICYNGRGACWSTKVLAEILDLYAGAARNLLFIDIHTGVGAYGEAYVIVGGDEASQSRVRLLFGAEAHDTDLIMPRPSYSAQGEVVPGAVFTAATIEAGTVDFGDGFREAMWLEMHDHMYGDPLSPAAQENSRVFRSFYYPTDPAWRRAWLTNCRATLERFIAGLEIWSRETAG